MKFEYAPPLLGTIEYHMSDSTSATIAVLHEYVSNEGDAYSWYRDALGRFFDDVLSHGDSTGSAKEPALRRHPLDLLDTEPPVEFELLAAGDILPSVELLGRRTADLHIVLASATGIPRSRPSRSTSSCSARRISRCATPRSVPCARSNGRSASCRPAARKRPGS